MFPATFPTKKVLFSHTQTAEEEISLNDKSKQSFYACFSFKDKLTNKAFTYSQSFDPTNLRFQEWTPYDNAHNHLRHLINTYKFTKKFQINCLKQRYHPLHPSSASKPSLFNSKCCKPVLQRQPLKGGKVGPRKARRDLGIRKTQAKEAKSLEIEKKERGREGEVYERSINHMTCEVNINNQYLIGLPSKLKKKGLIKQVLNQNKKRHCSSDKHQQQHSLYLQNQINTLSFAPLHTYPLQEIRQSTDQPNQFLELVQAGYLNEACLKATTNPDQCEAVDEKGENAFHIAVRQGDCRMLEGLLKSLPYTTSCLLLSTRNKTGRTALEKAEISGEQEVVNYLMEKMKEMRLR